MRFVFAVGAATVAIAAKSTPQLGNTTGIPITDGQGRAGRFVAKYEDVLGTTAYRFVYADEAPENLVRKPEDQLNQFFQKLKSHFLLACFPFEKFEEDAEKLVKDLSDIASEFRKSSPQKELLDQLKYVETMFDEMVDTIEPLKHYEFMGREDLHLVNRMIDFNVMLLGMFDIHGAPDTKKDNYEDTVVRYTVMQNYWNETFGSLGGVKIGVRSRFKREYGKAGRILHTLRMAGPSEEKRKKKVT